MEIPCQKPLRVCKRSASRAAASCFGDCLSLGGRASGAKLLPAYKAEIEIRLFSAEVWASAGCGRW
jgi:hypothetical protein